MLESLRTGSRSARFLTSLAVALTLVSAAPSASGVSTEKELLAAFKESFAAPDPGARAAAVTTLGDASRGLPDKGTGKRVAQALVKGLEDAELEVCQAALFELGSGRDVDTVIGALEAFLREHYRQLERRVESSDKESRDYVSRATVLFKNACQVFANYKDDRTAAVLIALLGGLKADTKKNDFGSRVIGALAAAALEQGTEAAAETAVTLTKTFGLPAQSAGAHELHDALSAFATKHEMTPPEWSDAYSEQWFKWLEANRNKLPKKLGRLATPPTSEPSHPLNGLPGKSG